MMQTEADLAKLCHEFTSALTEILAETAVGPARRGRVARAHAASKNIPITTNMHFAWQWRQHSVSGKLYKMPVIDVERTFVVPLDLCFANWRAVSGGILPLSCVAARR